MCAVESSQARDVKQTQPSEAVEPRPVAAQHNTTAAPAGAAAAAGGCKWTAADLALLVRLVKACQKAGAQGDRGDWKAYVKDACRTGLTDPAQHTWQELAAFVDSLRSGKGAALVQRHVQLERQLALEKAHQSSLPAVGLPAAWELVRRTMEHPRFAEQYTLPAADSGWQRTPRCALDTSRAPRLFALDCEMVASSRDARELVRLALVSARGDLVLQALVKPRAAVTDWRTQVTGITRATLAGVRLRRRDAQALLLQLLQGGDAVLVGHALHNDLHALRLDHQPLIDTALLFSYRGLARCQPSLADLTQALLGRRLRAPGAPHDCVEDARAAMDLVNHQLLHGPSPPLEPPDLKVAKEDLARLLVHSLPPGTSVGELLALFAGGGPQPASLDPDSTSARKAWAVFANAADANAAFSQLPGADARDSMGRPQKLIRLRSGPHKGQEVRIRKMAAHNGMMYGADTTSKANRSVKRKLQAQAISRGKQTRTSPSAE